ncbi:hypothetical protein JS533_007505 [Bifidobacterium amazonense]|uniref:Uncharacterized protein n=1 Tax=Bifidobacterium amazonense TaxID=2809027 RepID=A0ABS9VVJ1_9BIFI|nr:hypothetical protein [Bifidobacterium amazonense]MCH9276115.1 hypothetical protein [Bifidobacterium amazonense]
MSPELAEYIALARAGQAPMSPAERRAIYNHRKYLEIKARDPEYYTRRRREERRQRRKAQHHE